MRNLFQKSNAHGNTLVCLFDAGEVLFVNGAVDDSLDLIATVDERPNGQTFIKFEKATIVALSGLTPNGKTCEQVYHARENRRGVRCHLGARHLECPAHRVSAIEQSGRQMIKTLGGLSRTIVFDDEVLVPSQRRSGNCYIVKSGDFDATAPADSTKETMSGQYAATLTVTGNVATAVPTGTYYGPKNLQQ